MTNWIEKMSNDNLSLHPLCVFFPRIVGNEFDTLVADIKANGLREPITLYEGQVLDGGNRYAACLEAGVEPHFKGFEGGDVAAFVLSANMHRRHLSQGQNAAIIAQVTNWAEANQRGGRRATDSIPAIPLATVADRAKASGTSPRTQRKADKIAREAPELVVAVAQGDITIAQAISTINQGKPKSERQLEAAEAAENAFSDIDPVAELEIAHKENEELRATIAAIDSESPQGEILKLKRMLNLANSEKDRQTSLVVEHKQKNKWALNQLLLCGKAVGETEHEKIALAVEKFVKANNLKAA